jgi:hypothetical protein
MILVTGMLIPLAVIGGIAYVIVSATRGRAERERAAAGSAISIRRLFQYALLLAALLVAANGVSGVLSRVISDAAARRGSELAGPLALTVTGIPVFWLLGRWIWTQLHTDPIERRSAGWSLYLNVVLIGALITTVSLAFAIADGFISGDGYDGTEVAPFVVAVGVWAAHWVAWRRIPPTILPEAQVTAGSAIGLGSMAGGAGVVIGLAISRIFAQASEVDVAGSFGDNMAMAVVAIGIGAVVWSWHWLYNGLSAERTTLWHGYVILIGILGGLMTAVIGGATVLFLILQWIFGDPGASAAAHFQDTSPAFAAAVVGVGVWFYHKAILGFSRDQERTDIHRVYDYLVSGVALATIAGALTTLIVAVFSVFGSDDVVADGGSDVNIVITAVTLLLVGTPLWAVAWQRAQRAFVASPEMETSSSSRRVYLFAVFGIGGAVAFGAMLRLLFVIFEAILGEGSGRGIVDDIAIPIALLVTTGAIAAYHWTIYRAEKDVEPPRAKRDVTLIWAGGGDLREIEERAHVRLSVVRRTDEDGSSTIDAVVAAIENAPGERLVVVAGEDGVAAIPIESW